MQGATKRQIKYLGSVLICTLCLGAASAFAQSLGEAARQERARKQSQPVRSLHVYTNDDMQRPQILLPEDQARFQASRESTKPTLAHEDAIPAASPQPAEIPLGGVARHYRLQKQLREGRLLGDLPGISSSAPLAAPVAPKPASTPVSVPPLRSPEPRFHRTAPKQEPVLRAAGSVRVARGDSLWKLAKRHLGSGTKWRQLAALNPQLTNPDLIRVGEWVRLSLTPSASQVAKTVRVEKGDTLWKLARVELGSGLAWECIAVVNPHLQNVNLIYPGQTLAIPARCTAAP
jgi:nucleoid-associated protein YgaU